MRPKTLLAGFIALSLFLLKVLQIYLQKRLECSSFVSEISLFKSPNSSFSFCLQIRIQSFSKKLFYPFRFPFSLLSFCSGWFHHVFLILRWIVGPKVLSISFELLNLRCLSIFKVRERLSCERFPRKRPWIFFWVPF